MAETPATAKLALENGLVFSGRAFGARSTRTAELCFNTSMSGYQEIVSDPSYHGQIVVMTCAQIGNYGVNDADLESDGPRAAGFAVRELSAAVSNQRATGRLEEWLEKHGVPGISEIDTRAVTRVLRTEGALRGVLSTEPHTDEELVAMARQWPGLVGADLVREVAPAKPYEWREGPLVLEGVASPPSVAAVPARHAVVIDCGVKRNILRQLVRVGMKVTVVPAKTPAAAIRDLRPDGVLISNGPGDPEPVQYVVEALRALRDQLPMFGICLGHQLLGLAFGGRTYKLKFGHRGGNQPVRHLATGRVEMTAQNHGFAVDTASIEPSGLTPTHINLNDQTLEGFVHRELPIFAVQYHPEASPGPHDPVHLFDLFAEMVRTGRPPSPERVGDSTESGLPLRTR